MNRQSFWHVFGEKCVKHVPKFLIWGLIFILRARFGFGFDTELNVSWDGTAHPTGRPATKYLNMQKKYIFERFSIDSWRKTTEDFEHLLTQHISFAPVARTRQI
jgi:hypothetical protein